MQCFVIGGLHGNMKGMGPALRSHRVTIESEAEYHG